MGKTNAWLWYVFGVALALAGAVTLAAGLILATQADEGAVPTLLVLPFVLLSLAIAAIGIASLARGRAAAAQGRRLAESGIRLKATVTDVRRTWLIVNNQARWRVAYRYEYPAGSQRQGRSAYLRPAEAERFKAGDVVGVLVDSRAPGTSMLAAAP